MRNRKTCLIGLIFLCTILFSCSIVRNVRIQGDINADKELLVQYRTKIVLLRSKIIRDETITTERLREYYDPAMQGLVAEYNILAEEGKTLTAKDGELWQDWRIRVMELGNEVRTLERIYEGEIHGTKIETMYWEHRLLS